MASSPSKTTAPMRPPTVTPSFAGDDSLKKRMSVEKGIVDELLLVCGVIGSTDPSTKQFIPVTDCLNWLQDLQRALRRDDDLYRPISLLLGNWKVVSQKLLPLVLASRYDNRMVLTIVKILVILTKPMAETTKRAGRMVIDTKSKKVPESVIQEQITLRENALAQSELLLDYKRAFTYQHAGILGIFVSLLAEPLSKTGSGRSEMDHLTIELVLHLFRNLLCAEPILKSSTETSQKSLQLHNDLICLFEKELVLEILYVISQEMEARENAQYNLLMMELLHHLLKNQDATAVARSTVKKAPPTKQARRGAATRPPHTKATAKPGSLSAQLQREKTKLRPITTTSRHSHFGGTLVVNRLDGSRQYVSAAQVEKGAARPAAQKRKNKRTDPFIGSSSRNIPTISTKAQRTLHTFCGRFLKDCYGPLMKSLKNEFRRDSVRLEEGDKVVFFRIMSFFSQWWRLSGKKELGQLIFTMDVFTFNLVLNATDTFQQHKKYLYLAQAVACYSEMMQLLVKMYQSQDSTENVMALGLLDRLFYGSEPLDRLPRLLSKWTAGTLTREYACNLVELVHVTLKLLEANGNASISSDHAVDSKNKKKKKVAMDAVARMKQTAAEFDIVSYICRKLLSNQTVFLYTHVLSQYQINAPHTNHHVVALFVRMMKLHVVLPDDDDEEERGGDVPKNPLAVKPATLEPMLYNVQLFIVLEQVLNDATIRKEKEYSSLIQFATNLMGRFAKHTTQNPLAFVESLFRHSAPHRFCEFTTNLYVNEELRMLAERELLLEEHRRLAEGEEEDDLSLFRRPSSRPSTRSGAQGGPTQTQTNDDDDEEVEWNDDVGEKETTKATSSPSKSDDSDDDDEEEEKGGDTSGAEKEDDSSVAEKSIKPKDGEDSDSEMDDDDDATVHMAQSSSSATKDKAMRVAKDGGVSESGKEGELSGNGKDVNALGTAKSDDKATDDNSSDPSPKRKLLSDIDGNAPSASPEKRPRIQKKPVDDDSSDEELGFETQPPPAASGGASKNRLVIGDDEDD